MLPSGVSAEKDRLRALVGLDKQRMNSDFRLGALQANAQGRTEAPDSLELLSLLQKHDQLVTELYNELETCKNELSVIKQQSISHVEQNRRIFDELRAQIVKNNLGKDVVQSNQVVSTSAAANAGTVSLRYPHQPNVGPCPNCRELGDYVFKIERENKNVRGRLLDCEAELNQLRRQDAEYFRKVRESVSLADRAVLEKNETLVRMRHAQNRIETLEKDSKDSLYEHQKSLEQTRKSIQQQYDGEIEALKNQLNTVIKSESELRSRLNAVIQERDDLASERGTAKQRSSEKKKEIDDHRRKLRDENSKLSLANKEMKEALAEMEKTTKLRNMELTEKVKNLERQLTECRANIDNAKLTLNTTKRENADLRERYAVAEKDTWQLRQWKQRLEKQLDDTVKNKEMEMKEAVRIAELKHDQTKMDLERLLTNQNGLIFRLKEECKLLTDQLERVAKQSRASRRLHHQPADDFTGDNI